MSETGWTELDTAAAGDKPLLPLLGDLVRDALAAGADAADAVAVHRRALSVAIRLGRTESVESADALEIGLRVLVGRRQALVSASSLSAAARRRLVERALGMIAAVPEDPFCGLADPAEIATTLADVDGCSPAVPSAGELGARAIEAEAAALAVPGVTNSEGAEASFGRDDVALAASNGLAQTFRRSRHGLSVSVLAGAGTAMERDYDYAAAVHPEDLPAPEALGRNAGRRAVRRLGPRKVATCQVPVVFEPRAAGSLLGHLATAINGAAVARGTTFLKDRLGQRVFAAGVSVIDDPLRRRGLRSRPCDGEGIASRPLAIVEDGVLGHWLLDLRSARQLGLASNGRAARAAAALPAPGATNLYLAPGTLPPEAMIAEVREGLYVTELIGFGINGVTGDYSRGAAGLWIENGNLAYPVSEITISGNLLAMFERLIPASDLAFRYGIDAPTVRIDGMTVAGR